MNNNINGFVGYWHDRGKKIDRVFKRLNQNLTVVNGENWEIGYIGSRVEQKNNHIIAYLSAGGFSNIKDARVKIEKDCLILGREAFGRVPLYWSIADDNIFFATRLNWLLPIVKTKKISISGLYGYSCFSYFPTPLTPIEGIYAIAAGTEQIWKDVKQFKTKYLEFWKSQPKIIRDESQAIPQLQTLLENAVTSRLKDISNFPVGVFLSGGIDSSIVASLLARSGVKVKAYTLDFGSYGLSETSYAKQVAKHLNIPLTVINVTPKQVKQALIATVNALDLPFGDGVTVPLYLLSQAASQETEIIFNGEGGDQLFAGWTNKPIIAASLYDREKDFNQQYLATFHRLYGYEKQVFNSKVYQEISTLKAGEWLTEALDANFSDSLLDRLRRATLILKGAQNIHPRATNLAFYNGLRVRSPFCDRNLAQWSFRVSGEFFLQGAIEKYILKKAVESWLPYDIVWRQKRGMGVPLTEWLLGDLLLDVGKWLNPNVLRSEGIFKPDLATKVILGQLGGQYKKRRIGEVLWLLLVWEVWRSRVLGENVLDSFFSNYIWRLQLFFARRREI